MTEKMKKYFERYPGTPTSRKSSVRLDSYRLKEAEKQKSYKKVDVDVIISYVNDFLKAIDMNTVESPKINNPQKIDYEKIKLDNALADEKDIVWMKFTTDGYLGVVASSNDVNFDIPRNELEYENKRRKSSGILVHKLGESWDTSFVLVFPLSNIPYGYKKEDIERAIGNYLIDKKVPILDFYSHNYKFKRRK